MKRIKKVISILIQVIYFTLLISLLLSYLAPYANPKKFWLLAFFGWSFSNRSSSSVEMGSLSGVITVFCVEAAVVVDRR